MAQVEEPKIYFSREQYEYLNKVFSEVVGTPDVTTEVLRHRQGQRSVIYFIKDKVR